MKRMSFSETIFLFFLALIIFGPKKLPEIARMVGKTLNEFRRASNEFKAQIEQEIAHLEVEKKQTILPPSAPPEGTASRSLSAASSLAAASENASPDAPATIVPATDAPASLVGAVENSSTPNSGTPNSAEPATEALPTEAVTSPASQESHA